MLQEGSTSTISEPLPEIKLKTSDLGDLDSILNNEKIGNALNFLLNYFADTVASRILEKLESKTSVAPSTNSEAVTVVVEREVSVPIPVSPTKRTKIVSEETKKKMSRAQKARWDRIQNKIPLPPSPLPEEQQHQSRSDETKAKISASLRAKWASRKAAKAATTTIEKNTASSTEGDTTSTEGDC